MSKRILMIGFWLFIVLAFIGIVIVGIDRFERIENGELKVVDHNAVDR